MFCLPDSYELVDFFVLASSERRRRRSQAERRRNRRRRPEKRSKGGDCRVCCKRESVLKLGRRPKKKKERDVSKFGL